MANNHASLQQTMSCVSTVSRSSLRVLSFNQSWWYLNTFRAKPCSSNSKLLDKHCMKRSPGCPAASYRETFCLGNMCVHMHAYMCACVCGSISAYFNVFLQCPILPHPKHFRVLVLFCFVFPSNLFINDAKTILSHVYRCISFYYVCKFWLKNVSCIAFGHLSLDFCALSWSSNERQTLLTFSRSLFQSGASLQGLNSY